MDYFHEEKNSENQEYSEAGVRQRLAILVGQKNFSIEAAASIEMYNFIIYCISYGIFIGNRNDKPIEKQAKDAYHHVKSTALSQTMVEASRMIKNS